MKKIKYLAVAAVLAVFCGTPALSRLSPRAEADFAKRYPGMTDATLIELTRPSAEFASDPDYLDAVKFTYAYLSDPDEANFPPEFHGKNIEAALRARRTLPWGDSVPMREFMHFVLPERVNNEPLDSARLLFYRELYPRVKGLSMRDAILEVNHWCHEKVTYQPSDGRTSSPLSALSQAIGRCGEESTFAVAALRSVGIPARQVYTPRWAHTDDNHAWVEAWADGRWWFIGACEPEPILNLAWFNEPASRGMLMSTNTFGIYDGTEERLDSTAITTRINVTSNYAPVAPVNIRVTGSDGKPKAGAKVLFGLYNYGEYYPIAAKTASADGCASLTCGKGDLLVWATDGNHFGFSKASSAMQQPVEISLDFDENSTGSYDFDLVPPRASAELPTPTEAQKVENELRKSREDSIRHAYTDTFATADDAAKAAERLGLDKEKLSKILTESRGNHAVLLGFIESLSASDREKAVSLLTAVTEKDRRDIDIDVIADNIAIPASDDPLWADYVLSPRIDIEKLTAWRSLLTNEIPADLKTKAVKNPAEWVNWIARNIETDATLNPMQIRKFPYATWKTRRADAKNRDILFVAGARTMGIPARIDPVTGKPQWHDSNDWIDADFDNASEAAAPTKTGKLNLTYTSDGTSADPQYYFQFTISKIENGRPKLLEYEEGKTGTDADFRLDPGQYILTSGRRLANGSVLAHSEIFRIDAGQELTKPLTMHKREGTLPVIGVLNAESLYLDDATGETRSLLSSTGRGFYVLILAKPNHEPTEHVLNEICDRADELEATDRKIMLIYEDADALKRAQLKSRFPKLPANVIAGSEIDGNISKALQEELKLSPANRPAVVVADSFNRIVSLTGGYTIGSAMRLAETLRELAR